MSRTQKKFRLGAMVAMLAFTASACTVPLDLGISFLNCSIYILEPAQGAIVIPISAGVLELGCNLV